MIEKLNKNEYTTVLELAKKLNQKFSIDSISPNDQIIVYKENNDVVAFLQFSINFEVLDIINLYVNEVYRNKQIASLMLEYLNNNYLFEKIMLEVRTSNFEAINFYKFHGFKLVRTIKNYYSNGESAYSLERKKMKDVFILGIETSCDETSISIVKNGCTEIYTSTNTQIPTHKKYGGVVPELASRMHTENILTVFEDCMMNSKLTMDDIDAIAVTSNPGLLGSLIVGVEFAKTLSFVYDKPLISVNHLMGHIYANNLTNKINFPTLGLIVSGGHTQIIKMEKDYDFQILGETLDDAIGECYDKVARVLNLPYPGGPNVDSYARRGKPVYDMPKCMDDDSLNFSFSGLKSFIINFANTKKMKGEEINKYDLAASFQHSAVEEVIRKVSLAVKQEKINNLIIAGGVSANSYLREKLSTSLPNVNLSVPKLSHCTDNGAMIAAAAYPLYLNKSFSDLTLNPGK